MGFIRNVSRHTSANFLKVIPQFIHPNSDLCSSPSTLDHSISSPHIQVGYIGIGKREMILVWRLSEPEA